MSSAGAAPPSGNTAAPTPGGGAAAKPYSAKRLALYCVGGVLALSVVGVLVYVGQSRLASLLEVADRLRDQRSNPAVIAGFFLAQVLSTPLAIIPTGSMVVVSVMIGYLYGYYGLLLVWPATSVGMALCFGFGRCVKSCGGSSARRTEAREGNDEDAEASRPLLPREQNETSAAEKLGGAKVALLLRALTRLIDEQPIRSAVSFSFALPVSPAQFLLGWATNMRTIYAIPSWIIAAGKQFIWLLQGSTLGHAADFANGGGEQSAEEQRAQIAVNVVVLLAVTAIIVSVGNAIKKEFNEAAAAETTAPQTPTAQTSTAASGEAATGAAAGSATATPAQPKNGA